MLDDFIIRALLAGAGVAAIAGPLGSVVVWKRMAFFGDALAHSALLGIALSFWLGIHHIIGIVVLATLFSFLIGSLQKHHSFSNDTLLGIMAHGALATGLVVISFIDGARISLMSFLFGDILATGIDDIMWIYVGVTLGLGMLAFIWKPLLLSTINQDLAQVEGVNTHRIRLQFMLLVSLLVALSIKIVGVLLVTSLLVIPAATARQFAKTPERMALIASLAGMTSVALGLGGSLQWDSPAGPSIVVAAVVLFVSSSVVKRICCKG